MRLFLIIERVDDILVVLLDLVHLEFDMCLKKFSSLDHVHNAWIKALLIIIILLIIANLIAVFS